MNCPLCNGESKVVTTRSVSNDVNKRYRKCKACGINFMSFELVDDLFFKLVNRDNSYQVKDLIERSYEEFADELVNETLLKLIKEGINTYGKHG